MRKGLVFLLCFFTLLSIPRALPQGHYYYSGVVESVLKNSIKISDDKEFKIDPNCKIVIRKESNGRFEEYPATLDDVVPGEYVTLKIIANNVIEIIIEEYDHAL